MKLQKTTTRVLCGAMALVLATVSAAAATADSLPPMSEYNAPSDSAQQPNILEQTNDAANEQDESQEQEETNYLGKKSETVYVNLHADGSVRETIVTDWLHSDVEGAQLPDRTNLDDLTNVKGTETPEKNGDSLIWNLSEKDLYYRGKTDKPLPLEVSITYSLDGKEMPAEELAGKSGKMEMNLRFRNNTSNTVTVAGKQTEMQTPLMVIAGMSLSSDHFSNVEVSDGNVVADGNNQVISIMSMPGLEKSLNIGNYSLKEINDMEFPEDFTVTADVNEFEMGPIGIAVTSELPNLDDIKKSDDIDDMRQDLYDLQDMQDDLNRADPDRDLRSLITNPERTGASQLLVDDIFTFYDLNKDILDILPKYITEENIKLYDRIKYDLKDSTLDTMLDDEVVSDLLDLVDEISPAKLQSLVDNFEKLDLKALRTLMDRCSELTAVFGVSDAQKHIATLKKLAACREPMFALLGDAQLMDDTIFGQLMLGSIVAKIPATGKIDDNLKTLLSYLLKDDFSHLLPILEKDMAEGYMPKSTIKRSISPDLDRMAKSPITETVDKPAVSDSDEPPIEDTDSTPEPTIPDEVQNPDESTDGSTPAGDDESGTVPDDSDTTDAQDPQPTDSEPAEPDDDVIDAQSESDDAEESEESAETHTEVLAAYVENTELEDASEIESESALQADEETQAADNEPVAEDDESQESAEDEPQTEEAELKAIEAQPENDERSAQTETTDDVVIKSAVPTANGTITPRLQIIGALNSLFENHMNETCKKLGNVDGFKELIALRNHTNALNKAMTDAKFTAEDDLPGAMAFAEIMLTKTASLQSLIQDCFAPLVKNASDEEKPKIIKETMNQITEDLAANKENFTSMILLMNKLKEEDLLDDIEYIDDLRKDMQDLRPIVKDLNRDLDKNYINISLHQSPESTNTLLKMKDDLEIHRDISESLRTAMLPKNIDIGRSMIETLDRLEAKDAVGDSLDKMDDADELLDRKEALVDLSDEYQIFTDAPDELETELKFIMKTDEIEAPEEDKEVAEPEEQKGFFTWCKDLFHQVTGKD